MLQLDCQPEHATKHGMVAKTSVEADPLDWKSLMRQTFEAGVLACPRSGSRMQVIAQIDDPRVIIAILGHEGLPRAAPAGSPRTTT
jgi:hypothetical protein